MRLQKSNYCELFAKCKDLNHSLVSYLEIMVGLGPGSPGHTFHRRLKHKGREG